MAGAALLEDELDEASGAADEELEEEVAVALEEELPGEALLEELTVGGLDELPVEVLIAELPIAELGACVLLWPGAGGALLAAGLDDVPAWLVLLDGPLDGCGGGGSGGRASSRHGAVTAQACDGYGG